MDANLSNVDAVKQLIEPLSSQERGEVTKFIAECGNRDRLRELNKGNFSALFMSKYDNECCERYVICFAFMKDGIFELESHKWSEDEKDYIHDLTDALCLYENMENTYAIYSNPTSYYIDKLKDCGLTQVDPWW